MVWLVAQISIRGLYSVQTGTYKNYSNHGSIEITHISVGETSRRSGFETSDLLSTSQLISSMSPLQNYAGKDVTLDPIENMRRKKGTGTTALFVSPRRLCETKTTCEIVLT